MKYDEDPNAVLVLMASASSEEESVAFAAIVCVWGMGTRMCWERDQYSINNNLFDKL